MKRELTNNQRHGRILILLFFGFILLGGVGFLLVDPSWFKSMIVLLPIVVSAVCIFIVGMDHFQFGCLASVVVTTGIEILVLYGRLGGRDHDRFWVMMPLLVLMNATFYILTVAVMFALVHKAERAKRKVEFIDYKGRFR